MISVYRRGRIYWIRGSVQGVPIGRQSLGTQFKDVAARLAAKFELEIHGGIEHRAWADFVGEFLESARVRIKPPTLQKYTFVLTRFGEYLTQASLNLLEEITREVISRYTSARSADVHTTRRQPIGAEGLKADLRVLRAAFLYARRNGLLKDSPIRARAGNLNSVAGNTQPFTAEEISRMLVASESQERRRGAAPLRPILLTGC